MPLKNTAQRYGSVARFFHWVSSVLIIGMVIFGLWMTSLERSSFKFQLYDIHKSLGLSILILIVLRIIWRIFNRVPAYPSSIPRWEQKLAHAFHGLFYLLVLSIPLSGWLMSTAAQYFPNFWGLGQWIMPGVPASQTLAKLGSKVHSFLAYALIVMLVLHVAMALKHHFLAKNNILKRMLPFSKNP